MASLTGPSPFLKKVAARKLKSLTISSSETVPLQIDGDLAGSLPAEISIIPSAIECILPARTVRKFAAERRS